MKKKYLKIVIFIICSILVFILGIYLFYRSCFNYKQDVINFKEESKIDYKVYLKENNFFEQPYLESGQPYITTLIDYIDIDYNYSFKINSLRKGKYVYYIKGVMSADTLNSDTNYWEKTYTLSEPKVVEYDGKKDINFSVNTKIDYQYYNDLLLEFKKQFGLSMDGKFKVFLYVENYIYSDIVDSDLKCISTSSLEIPLTKATIEVPIKVNNVNKKDKLVSDLIYSDSPVYMELKVASIICIAISALFLFNAFLIAIRMYRKKSIYSKKLNKILKTYDGIIVEVKNLPDLINFNIINVSSFEELLDAHSEARQPINYYSENDKAIFVLINDNMAWEYVLNKKDWM